MTCQDITVLTPQGRLDAANVRPLETELKEHVAAGRTRLLVDLKEVCYISSHGLWALLTVQKAAQKHGGMLKLCCLNPRLVEIFEMSGFDRVFEIFETREQAEKSFSSD